MNTAKIKLMVGGLLIVGGIGYLGMMAVNETGQYAIDVGDYTGAPGKFEGRGLRLSGIAAKGTWVLEENRHSFGIAERTDLENVIPVHFEGTMPDTFREGAELIVEGKMDASAGVFVASQVTPQCASKYEKVPDDYFEQPARPRLLSGRAEAPAPASGLDASVNR